MKTSALGKNSLDKGVQGVDEHYEKKVFPLLRAGQNKFNWIAAFFSTFWFAYKGLWRTWFVYLVPFAFLTSILALVFEGQPLASSSVTFGVNITMIVTMGFIANRKYFERFESGNVTSKGNVFAGFGGVLLFTIFVYLPDFVREAIKSI